MVSFFYILIFSFGIFNIYFFYYIFFIDLISIFFISLGLKENFLNFGILNDTLFNFYLGISSLITGSTVFEL